MWSVVRRACAGIIVLAAAIVVALNRPVAKAVLLIILVSVSFSYLVVPLAMRLRLGYKLERPPLRPLLAVLLIYLALFVLGMTTWSLAAGKWQRQLADLRTRIPTYTERGRQRLETVERFTDRLSPPEPYAALIRRLSSAASVSIQARAKGVGEEILASRPFLPWMWLVPVVALLLISCFSRFRDSAVAHLPEGHLRWRGEEFFRHVNSVLAGYTRAQTLSCLLVGTVSVVGFWLIGVSHALLLGTMAGILEFVPAVGPLSLAIAACSIVSDEQLFLLVVFLLVLRLTQDYFIYPLLVGHEMHLHPVAIVLASLAGALAGGMLGILAAIPFVGIASVAIRHWREYWSIEKLLKEHGRQASGGMPEEETAAESVQVSNASVAPSRDHPRQSQDKNNHTA